MNTHFNKSSENKKQAVAHSLPKMQRYRESSSPFVDKRPEAIAQRQLNEGVNQNPHIQQLKVRQEIANNSPKVEQLKVYQNLADDSKVQLTAGPGSSQTVQEKQTQERANPAKQLKNKALVNDDKGIESEADITRGEAGFNFQLKKSDNKTIQRLVAYAEEDNDTHNDYAVMKMLHQVSRHRDGHPIVPLNGQTDFSKMKAGETLFLAGHGKRETGNIRMGGTTTDLISWLNHNKRGIPNNIGEITILTCYSGEVIGNDTLANKIAAGLNHDNIPVSGAKGFSFGTPSLQSTGKSSVLALSNENLYWLGNPQTMGWQWAEMKPTSTGGALKEMYPTMTVDMGKTIAENVAIELNLQIVEGGEVTGEMAKTNKATVINALDTMMGTFAKKANRIQNRLDFIIQRLPGTTVAGKLEVLRYPAMAGKDQKYAHAWSKLIIRQHELFKDYYVFRPGNEAFHTVQS